MRILCLYSVDDYYTVRHPLASFAAIPFGISYVASALKDAGHSVSMVVCSPHQESTRILQDKLHELNPQMICATAVSTQFPAICKMTRLAKKVIPDVKTVLGGAHATLNLESVAKEDLFDAICIGEGERPTVEYASCIERQVTPASIAGLWLRRPSGEIEKNAPADFLRDLDSLPIIDRYLWEDWVYDRNRMHAILAGRGCPNNCSYCSNHALRAAGHGKYVRFRSPENILQEVEQIVTNYPEVRSIYFEIETLGAMPTYPEKLCSALKQFVEHTKKDLSFGTNLAPNRTTLADPELPRRLKSAHFTFVNLGLESGSERIRTEVLRRPQYTNAELDRFCERMREAGLELQLYVMLGLPGETLADYLETIEVTRRCAPTNILCSIFYPYPGTDLHTTCKNKGLINDDPVARERASALERRRATLDLPGFPRWRIQLEYMLFPYRAFRGRKPPLAIIANTARVMIGSSSVLNRVYRASISSSSFLRAAKAKATSTSR